MPRKPDNISQEDWDAVDSPPLSDRMLRGMRPAREVLRPALFEKLTKVRGPQKTPTKEAVSLRLDRDVLDHFRAKGQGWQTEINDVLRRSVALYPTRAEAMKAAKTSLKKRAMNRPKTVAELASAGLKNPATLSPKDIKSVSAIALTQAPGRTSRRADSTRRDKKGSK